MKMIVFPPSATIPNTSSIGVWTQQNIFQHPSATKNPAPNNQTSLSPRNHSARLLERVTIPDDLYTTQKRGGGRRRRGNA